MESFVSETENAFTSQIVSLSHILTDENALVFLQSKESKSESSRPIIFSQFTAWAAAPVSARGRHRRCWGRAAAAVSKT